MALRIHQDKYSENIKQVLIVDDHPVVCDGLTALINHQRDLNVYAQAEDASQALNAIAESKPDIAIVDISLKGSDGIDLTKMIKAKYPKIVCHCSFRA